MALMNCPDCGTEISTEAPTCPKCGRPNVPAKRKPGAISTGCAAVILIVAIIGFLGWLSSNDSSGIGSTSSSDTSSSDSGSAAADTAAAPDEPRPVQAPTAEQRPIQNYTAEQLYAMFHANEIKANKTIGKAIVRFTGTIDSIQQSDFSKTPELQIRGKCGVPDDCQDPESWETFEADLKASELSAASGLVKGQTITLQCNQVSMPLDVLAQDCTIVPESNESKSGA